MARASVFFLENGQSWKYFENSLMITGTDYFFLLWGRLLNKRIRVPKKKNVVTKKVFWHVFFLCVSLLSMVTFFFSFFFNHKNKGAFRCSEFYICILLNI